MIQFATSQLPQRTIFNESQMSKMWGYMEWFLGFYNPFIMIGVALALAAGIVGLIVFIFTRRSANDDDDNDVDYHYY